MGYQDFMGKVRHLDNKSARWITRHFYLLFFEIVLVIIFIVFFVNHLKVIDVSVTVTEKNLMERILLTQSVNQSIIVMLMLLNSFWMLYIFNSILRVRLILRDINFNLSRRRSDRKYDSKSR